MRIQSNSFVSNFLKVFCGYYSPERIYLYLILLMYIEVGPVRVLCPVFEEVVNNCFGLFIFFSFCKIMKDYFYSFYVLK